MRSRKGAWRLGVVLFEDFELLDVCGPIEMFALAERRFDISLIGPQAGPVRSAQGPSLVADLSYREAETMDIVMVPGGIGTRRLVEDKSFIAWLTAWASRGEGPYVTSVCTGAGVLARAGLLDGYRATSNKLAFEWARSQSDQVQWVRSARWAAHGHRWTSSGISAGIDMALALIAELYGDELASHVATAAEYVWNRDPTMDPFADLTARR
jgi:transcriptional regulator GlxA family with amidase domain